MSVIQARNLKKTFGSKRALDGISFTVNEGEVFGFLGPNGAGKSTAIRCLMDYIHPESGNITILGKDAHADSALLKSEIGFLSSDLQLYEDWTGKEHLELIESVRSESASMRELAAELDLDLSKKAKHLSTGNKQKLAIVLAFAGNPRLIIMDEPTRGLDPLLQNKLYELIQKFAAKGGSVFFSSHNLSEVQRLCDAVLVIRAGKVVAAKSLADLRDVHVHLVSAVVKRAVKPEDLKLSDVEVLHHTKTSVSLKIRGDINPVLVLLQKHGLTDLEVSHASLEDMFMELYGA